MSSYSQRMCRQITVVLLMTWSLHLAAEAARGQQIAQHYSYEDLRNRLLAQPEVRAALANPRKHIHKHCSNADFVGIFPDLHVVEGKAVPVLSLYIVCRAKFESTGFALVRAAVRPTFVDGVPKVEVVAGEVSDVRIDKGLLSEIGIGVSGKVRGGLVRQGRLFADRLKKDLVAQLNGMAREGAGIVNNIVLTKDGVTFVADLAHPTEYSVTHTFSSKHLNHHRIPKATFGNEQEACLIVTLFHDHLSYAIMANNFRRKHLGLDANWPTWNGHNDGGILENRGLSKWMRNTGIPDERGRVDRNPVYGRNAVVLYLKRGQAFPNLNHLRNAKGQTLGWNDRIGTLKVRPGAKYRGERLVLYDQLKFNRDHPRLRSYIAEVGDHYLRSRDVNFFGQAASMRVE